MMPEVRPRPEMSQSSHFAHVVYCFYPLCRKQDAEVIWNVGSGDPGGSVRGNGLGVRDEGD